MDIDVFSVIRVSKGFVSVPAGWPVREGGPDRRREARSIPGLSRRDESRAGRRPRAFPRGSTSRPAVVSSATICPWSMTTTRADPLDDIEDVRAVEDRLAAHQHGLEHLPKG